MHAPHAWFLVAVSIFVLVAVARDWDWFFTHRKARLFVRIFGRQGARVVYGLLGVVLGIGGLAALFAG